MQLHRWLDVKLAYVTLLFSAYTLVLTWAGSHGADLAAVTLSADPHGSVIAWHDRPHRPA